MGRKMLNRPEEDTPEEDAGVNAARELDTLRSDPEVTFTVEWAMEKYSPVQFNTCDVGPFSMTLTCRYSEVEEKMAEAYAKLESLATKLRLNKLADFRASLGKR